MEPGLFQRAVAEQECEPVHSAYKSILSLRGGGMVKAPLLVLLTATYKRPLGNKYAVLENPALGQHWKRSSLTVCVFHQ